MSCKYIFGTITPSDDIIELQWVDISEINSNWISKEIVDEHKPLS
jgi:hypothetical protein